MTVCYSSVKTMRKSMLVFAVLLSFVFACSMISAAASFDSASNSPWNSSVATACEADNDDNGVNVDNLTTIAPLFDSVLSHAIPVVKCARRKDRSANSSPPPSLVTLNRTFRI